MPPDLALWLTLISSNYPCLKHIFMVLKVFEPMKFYCSFMEPYRKYLKYPSDSSFFIWTLKQLCICKCIKNQILVDLCFSAFCPNCQYCQKYVTTKCVLQYLDTLIISLTDSVRLNLNYLSDNIKRMFFEKRWQTVQTLTRRLQGSSLIQVLTVCSCIIIGAFLVLKNKSSELQIRGGIQDNSKIIFLISQQKHMLWPLIRIVSMRQL